MHERRSGRHLDCDEAATTSSRPNTCSARWTRRSRDAFAARIAREPDLARAIDAWRDAPGAARRRDRAGRAADVPVASRARARRARCRAAIERGDARWWDRLAFWRGASLAGLAATAACVIALVALPRNPASDVPAPVHSALPHPVRLVTTMNDGKGRNTYMAAVDDDACTLVLMPLVEGPDAGRGAAVVAGVQRRQPRNRSAWATMRRCNR